MCFLNFSTVNVIMYLIDSLYNIYLYMHCIYHIVFITLDNYSFFRLSGKFYRRAGQVELHDAIV